MTHCPLVAALLAWLLVVPVTAYGDDANDWDAKVEYKVSLALDRVGSDDAVQDTIAAVEKAWHEVTGTAVDFARKACRTIRFYDTADRSLRATHVALRVRVRGPKDAPCLEGGQPAPGNGEWDVSAKWASDDPDARPAEAAFARETDWLAAADGAARVRFAAAVEKKSKIGAPPADAVAALRSLDVPKPKRPTVDGTTSVCAGPIEDLRWQDDDARGEPTLTVWRESGTVIAAELSFDGAPGDATQARQLRDALRAAKRLAPLPAGKVDAVYAHCTK